MSDTIADDTDAEFLAAAQRLLKKRDAQIGRLLALLKDIEAEWPATTSVLRERGRALIAEAEAMDNDRIDDARI